MTEDQENEAGPFYVAMKARRLAQASMLQFLHDLLEASGFRDPIMAAAIWAFLLNHDHAQSAPELVRYVSQNGEKVEGCAMYILQNDVEFARAAAFAVFLEFGWAIAYSTRERAESILSGDGFKLLRRLHPELTRSPETVDPNKAIAFFGEWTKKWNKRA